MRESSDNEVRGGRVEVRGGRAEAGEVQPEAPVERPRRARWRPYAWSATVVALATAIASAMSRRFDLEDLIMVYLLGLVLVAYRLGRGPSIFASVLSVAVFDFCFVPPYFTFAIADMKYLLTFAVMLVIGLMVSGLTERVRQQAQAARLREERTSALYALTRELAGVATDAAITRVAARHIESGTGGKAAFLLPDRSGALTPALSGFELQPGDQSAAAWVFEHGEPERRAPGSAAGAAALYLPLASSARTVGVLGVLARDERRLADPEQRKLIEAFAQQTAMALERARLADQAQAAHLRAEREELYSSLLSSVSHDLRTPLAAITGAASTLLEDEAATEAVRRDLLQTIFEEADRLNRLVTNLLDMTRLESGSLKVRKEWTPLEEVIGTALNRLDRALGGREVKVELPSSLPLIPIDGPLLGQVFLNLLENAAKYTPPASPIEIRARAEGDHVVVELADRGPGLPPGSEDRIFRKFFRAPSEGGAPGTGLGLAICRGIVLAHGGAIAAENRAGGGAVFQIKLPLEGAPPAVPAEGAPSAEPISAADDNASRGDARGLGAA